MLVPENWPNSLLPGLRKVYVNVFREFTSNLPALFSMQKSEKAQEFDLQDDEFKDFEKFTGTIPYDDMREGYKTTYTHDEYARGFKITRTLVQDELYGTINKKPSMLALAARRRREKDGASVFNNAFNSSFTGGDSLALCSTAHTSRNSDLTQSNYGTLPLTGPNIEATRRRMMAFHSGRDGIINVSLDMILVPLALEEVAWQIINSRGQVDTAQNNPNFHYGKYKLLVWPNFLTSSSAWFSIDSQYMKQFLLWFDREPVQFFKDQDFGTLVSAFAGYMRYSYGWSDWKWVYGNLPA